MAGHSRWANIKHKKAKSDVKRGKIFTKLVKEIMVAAKLGGGDISSNPRLRGAVENAKAENLPSDNITRAIKKGAGELEGVNYEEGVYEGYGPAGVAILIQYMTDNKNRTVSDVRTVLTRLGGKLGESGSVGWLFEKKGFFSFDTKTIDEGAMMDIALEAGADDVQKNDEDNVIEVYCDPTLFHSVKTFFDDKKLKYAISEISMIPKTTIKVEGPDVQKMLKLMEELEDLDDVQNVYANFDISREDMEKVA